MTGVVDFPRELYTRIITSQKYKLRSVNQSAGTNWNGTGGKPSGPHTQFWTADVSLGQMEDPILQDVEAILTKLKGRANVLRFAYSNRWAPYRDRSRVAGRVNFSDGTSFTDGTGFVNGLLPPEVFLVNAAAAGSRYLTLACGSSALGVPNAFRAGDLLQIKPGGIAGTVPHLYQATLGGDTDASGNIGLTIEPKLRQGVAAGDTVSLRYPDTLFRLADDNQGEIDVGGGGFGTCGFQLIEALDLVP